MNGPDSDGDGSGDNADVDADGDGFVDCIVGTTKIQDGLCQLPDSIQSDMTLTYLNTPDYQQPDYFMANLVVVGDISYIDNQEQLNAVLANSATLTIEPGVHVRATQEGALVIASGSKLIAVGTQELPITFSSDDEDEAWRRRVDRVEIGGFAPHYDGNPSESDACFNREPNTDHDHETSTGVIEAVQPEI